MIELRSLSDDALLARAERCAAAERTASVDLIACLAEIQRRDILLDRGYAHLFDYCVRALKMSEGSASRRVAATRAVRRWPEALSMLSDGSINLSALSRIEPYIHCEEGLEVLSHACGLDRTALDVLVTERAAKRAEARRIEEPEEPLASLPFTAAPAPQSNLRARSHDRAVRNGHDRVRFSFEGGASLERKLERAGSLLSHRLPSRRLEDLIEMMADIVIRKLDPIRHGKTAPRASKGNPRRVPWRVRREVWTRDGGRCAYQAADGTRCAATRRLQYDHVVPWAMGGRSDDAANIRLLCRAHNLWAGKKAFPAQTARALGARAAGSSASAR